MTDDAYQRFGDWWMRDAPSFAHPTESYGAAKLAFAAGAKWALDQAEAACRQVYLDDDAPTVVQYCEAIVKLKEQG